MRWQVQEAKQRFSELLRAAKAGVPQIVTRHGTELVVIIDIDEYHKLRGEQVGLMDYLRADPIDDVDLDLDREIDRPRDAPRDTDLVG